MQYLTNKPPSRGGLARMVEGCIRERHALTLTMPALEVSRALGEMDYDKLIELAFFAISDIGDEDRHKEIFIDKLEKEGIQ